MSKIQDFITNTVGRLFLNNWKTVIVLVIFVLVLIFAFATKARAEETMNFEAGSQVGHAYAPLMGFVVDWPNSGPGDSNWECALHLLGSSGDNRNNSALSCLLVDGFGKFDIGLGLAYLHHVDEFNGSQENFTLHIAYRFTDTWSLSYRHFSNAGQTEHNLGRDMVFVSRKF